MKKKSLHNFLDYTGYFQYKKDYYEFKMKDAELVNPLNYLKAYNPAFDNLFKKVFRKEYILMSFLNDILFPKENKIKKIQILNQNFNGPYGKYSIGSINLDMLCACFFDEETSTENNSNINLDEDMDIEMDSNKKAPNVKKYDLVVDIEMQRILKESPTERFLKYMSYIDAGIPNEKVLIIVLLIKTFDEEKENNFSKINYVKKSVPKYKTLTEYGKHSIIEVDLNYCYNLIENKKELWIVDEDNTLTKKGKEWIKLLTMQIWCDTVSTETYALPNLEYLNFFQPQVKNALKILNVDEPLYGAFIEIENEELNKNNKILNLEKANEQKDKQIKKLIEGKEKYKKQLLSLGVSEQQMDKSADDLEYYDDEKDEDDSDESYKPGDDEEDLDMD